MLLGTSASFSRKTLWEIYLLENNFFELIKSYFSIKECWKLLQGRYLTFQEAVVVVLQSTESDKGDIVILPPGQDSSYATNVEDNDKNVRHKNNLLPNNVAAILEVHKHNKNECEVASYVPAVQSEEKTNDHKSKRERKPRQWRGKRKSA